MKVNATSRNDSFIKISNFNKQMASLHKNSLDIYKAKRTLELFKAMPMEYDSRLA